MAPGYRNSTQSRRQNRGLVDHDIFEGLPVRNWRRDIVVVAPPPPHNTLNQQADKWDVELPWGMPKDVHLLPQHSQDLLRAARSGKIYQQRPPMEDDQEDDSLMADKPEKKEVEPKDDGFTVKTWKLVPKHLEGPEFEYLAKRRKGLRGAAVKVAAPQGPTMTKMTVRKTDDQGNSFIEHVVVPEGQAVEGEVIAQTVVTDTAAVSGVAEPIKRRPPPPKRKGKGPGRGRKKKVMLAPTSVPAEAGAIAVDGQAPIAPKAEAIVGHDGVKQEVTAPALADNEDTPMGDGSQGPSDDEDDEGSGSEDVSEEGEIMDEDQEREDEEEKAHTLERERERERMIQANRSMEHKLPAKPAISGFVMDSPGGPFPGQRPSLVRDLSGSPLKNEVAPRSYSPSVHNPEDEAEGEEDEEPHNGRRSHRSTPYVSRPHSEPASEPQHHPEMLPNTADTVQEVVEEVQEDVDGGFQSMLDTSPNGSDELLDGGVNNQDTVLAETMAGMSAEIPNKGLETEGQDQVMDSLEMEEGANFEGLEAEGQDQVMDSLEMEEGENFEDLLGSLEEHLNEHEAAASAHLLSRSDSLPVTGLVSMRSVAEEEGEQGGQTALENADVDGMAPAQAAAETSAEVHPPAEEKAETEPAEREAVTEVPAQDSPRLGEAVDMIADAAVVAPVSPNKDEQNVGGGAVEQKESESILEEEGDKNVAKNAADVDA